ncbi:hypothetical protein Tco_0357427, partial [Tanacetum coccineum]
QAEPLEEINLNVVTRSNGQKRYFSTLMTVLSIFDREDLNAVYQLVMDKYQDEMPEGFERVLWGDLMVLFNPDEQDEFWNSQHDWIIISWKLHSSSGVHTLMTNEGLVIHMLTEKKYPLKKEIVVQMLKIKLESEEESTMALELIRLIKKAKELASPQANGLSWLVRDQTVLALASPNTNDEELSIPEQTATGKGTSNPLMAESPDSAGPGLLRASDKRSESTSSSDFSNYASSFGFSRGSSSIGSYSDASGIEYLITILKTNTPYPSRKIRRIRACTHQRPQKIKDQYAVSRGLNTPYSRYGINIIFWKISNMVPTLRNPQYACMTRSSTNELYTPYKDPEREFRSSRRHFKTLSLDELRSPDFNLLSDEEYSEEEEEEEMAETMEHNEQKP